MRTRLYSSVECARILGVAHHRIGYAQRTGRVKDASYRVAGKAIYTESDLRKMARVFGVQLKEPEGNGGDVGG